METIFLELHQIHTKYDKTTTATITPTIIALNKILHLTSDNSYEFFNSIVIPETINKESISGIPTEITFGYRTSIKVLESREYIQKQLKKYGILIIS